MAVEGHQRLGTFRRRWEPTLIQNRVLAAPFIADGEQELASRLEEADPVLDKTRGLLENVKANLDEITGRDVSPYRNPRQGRSAGSPQAGTEWV